MTATDADDRAELLRRLAEAGASATLQDDVRTADPPLEILRALVLGMEAAPLRPTLAECWAMDATLYAEAVAAGKVR